MLALRLLSARRLLAAAALSLCACAPQPPARAASAGTPVVLIVVDTLRADRLRADGPGRDTAAGLDAFLEDATCFESCWAPSPWTTPSTATILTGLHPLRHGTTGHGRALPYAVDTLAERLSDAGWQTAGFSHNHNASEVLHFEQGFGVFEAHTGKSTAYDDVSLMVDRVEQWLEREASSPFLLYLQPMNVHGPYKVPEDHRSDLLGRPPRAGFHYYGTSMRAILKQGELSRRERISPGMLASLGEQYDTAARYTLDQVGRVLELLRERGLYDRALIAITADHGEELFEHGGFSHGYSLHRELLQVPLYVKLPGQRRGGRVAARVSLADVTPTILDALGVRTGEGELDGRSLLPLARRAAEPAAGTGVFATTSVAGNRVDHGTPDPTRSGDATPVAAAADEELLFHVDWWKRCTALALLSGPWKLLSIEHNYEGLDDALQLFDVERDPGEQHDVSAAHPDVVADLLRRLDALSALHRSRSFEPGEDVLSSMDRQVLEELGYL